MVMQLDPQSRWQSWMRMRALDIRPVRGPGPLIAGCTRLEFSDWRGIAGAGRLSVDRLLKPSLFT